MLFRRFCHERLAQASYLIACQKTREAVIVDPLLDLEQYLDAAAAEGVQIRFVTETHLHADFLSGATALAERTGATLMRSGEGRSAQPASATPGGSSSSATTRWLHDGDRIDIGSVRLDVLRVPGHTPEHIVFLVTDTAASVEPMGLLSGDFLFVGDVGRPDLLERAVGMHGTMEQSARQLFASLQRIRTQPEFLQIWPGHGAGSACGKALGAVPQSTLGDELRSNWAFGEHDEQCFVEQVLGGQPEPPRYFARIKSLNAGAPRPLDRSSELADTDEARRAIDSGALVVDIRSARDFAAGHLPGSVNVPLGKSFLGWAGSVLPADRELVLLAGTRDLTAASSAWRDLALIGFDRVAGVDVTDDPAELSSAALATLPSRRAETIGAVVPDGTVVLDVRNRSEWDEGHIPGARLGPLAELPDRLDELRASLGGATQLVVHCQGGSRSAVAASLLAAEGFPGVTNLEGGFGAWKRAGHAPSTEP